MQSSYPNIPSPGSSVISSAGIGVAASTIVRGDQSNMSRNGFEFPAEVLLRGEEDVEIMVKVGGGSPGTPDSYGHSGWEQGDPTEAEITGAYVPGKPDEDVWELLDEKTQEKLYQRACERVEENSVSDDDDHGDEGPEYDKYD